MKEDIIDPTEEKRKYKYRSQKNYMWVGLEIKLIEKQEKQKKIDKNVNSKNTEKLYTLFWIHVQELCQQSDMLK